MANENHLVNETSPYLKQHVNNTVAWYPWGEEAFEKAKKENKPIFLSIGYSTCHWCHVMAHESFEDNDIGNYLNDHFVSIKVDREEYPEVDHLYMSACQLLTGQGGWPLTVFLLPDKKPFFAGTYFPKYSTPYRPGFYDLITHIQEAWTQNLEELIKTANQLQISLIQESLNDREGHISSTLLEEATQEYARQFDPVHKGFGRAPKFPSPHNLIYLLSVSKDLPADTQSSDGLSYSALEMAVDTLIRIRFSGLWDHVGNGFHRYATNTEWTLPHFEKMLYDNALLMRAYAEAFKKTSHPLFKDTVVDIVAYMSEQLLAPEGAFYSGEDADSEGEEGRFYMWTQAEINNNLTKEEYDVFTRYYPISEEGNVEDEVTRKKTGKNSLFLDRKWDGLFLEHPKEYEMYKQAITPLLKKLKQIRRSRIRPGTDNKILTDWNGYAIGALAKASVCLNMPALMDLAKTVLKTIESHLIFNENQVLHRLCDGQSGISGTLNDYATLIWAYLDVYEATQESTYLEQGAVLLTRAIDKFWDKNNGGFYLTSDDHTHLYLKQKDSYDGTTPSANSIMFSMLNKYAGHTKNNAWAAMSKKTIDVINQRISVHPFGYGHWLLGVLDNPSVCTGDSCAILDS